LVAFKPRYPTPDGRFPLCASPSAIPLLKNLG
jgi:hypothetical protein